MKFVIIAALVALALASDRPYYPKPAYPAADGYDYAPMPYSFDWAVLDQASYNDFGHKETSDGKVVTGTYYVVLPDGRRQVVTYKADDYGYVADVKYEGEASYPEYKPSYPAYPKPAYAPPAYPKPTYAAPAYPKPTYAPPAYPKASYPSYPRPSYPTYPRPAYPSYPRPSYPSYPKPSYPVSTTTEAVTETAAPVLKEAEEAVEAVAVTEAVSEAAVAVAEPIAEPETSTDAV
ncbi:adhesive plaque matrix protein-like isoform X2 [Daphnia carinata]|uniref:adhesive plaque matrix protein-like isoform X2 n=1 Tax=Daphnia carinata TaxID=120202 RepID=UPI00257B1E8D|nr:adhesive plaque matrix protein-like isoform X2 [Daphnia carinata]